MTKIRKNYRLDSDVVKALELLVAKGIFTSETAAIELMVKHYTKNKFKMPELFNDPFSNGGGKLSG